MKTRVLLPGVIAGFLVAAGCGDATPPPAPDTAAEPAAASDAETGAAIETLLDAALAGAHRSDANRARDQYRHPKETLLFFGLQPDMVVVELFPGNGWYTEVLAPVLQQNGKLIAAQFEATEPPSYRPRVVAAYQELLARPEFAGTQMVTISDAGAMPEVADASVDMVLTFRNVHNWINAGTFEAVFAEAARVLKPGGVLGVVEHRANEGVDPVESAQRGYVPESYVIEVARAAGFELDGRSEVNANPADTKDYDIGVWALPPSLRGDLDRRDEMLAIGESDRMTLRFVKR